MMQLTPSLSPVADAGAAPQTAEPAAGRRSRFNEIVRLHRLELAGGLLILIVGLALRLLPFFGVPDRLTLDESLYIGNVRILSRMGPFEYPALIQGYVLAQSKEDMVMLPPTRCVFILLGWAWNAVFHCGAQLALRHVATTFSVLSLLLSGLFAFRLGGSRFALAVGALMAVSPMELMLAHRELVDGVFAFWALLSLWLLWENLQRPGRLGWLAAYAGAISVMVLTKENAAFAAAGLGGVLGAAMVFPGLKLGKVQWSTVVATVAGGAMGVLVLICLAGDPRTLIQTYQLLVLKAEKMSFAYETGGGPWFRYIVDLMLISPAVLLPAIGGIFALRRDQRQGIFLLVFIVCSCAVMVNVKNGMNVRYATMWDMPLRYLAAGPILQMAGAVRRAPVVAAVLLLCFIAGTELHHYWLFFVSRDIGEPVTQYLMYTLQIIRSAH